MINKLGALSLSLLVSLTQGTVLASTFNNDLGEVSGSRPPKVRAEVNSALALLVRDFRSAKIAFGGEKRLYHYFDLHQESSDQVQNKMRTNEGRKALMWDRISFATNKFWKSAPVSGPVGLHAGEGLYLALDPNISEEYGKMLIEFRTKPNTYYLDFARGVYLKPDTVRAIYTQGFLEIDSSNGIPDSLRFSEMTLNMILQVRNAKFRTLVHQALRSEGIMMAEYNWRSDLDVICGEQASKTAFVYFGDRATMDEFTSVQMADVKNAYPSVKFTRAEEQVKAETMAIISIIRANIDANSESEQRDNLVEVFGKRDAQALLRSFHSCAK